MMALLYFVVVVVIVVVFCGVYVAIFIHNTVHAVIRNYSRDRAVSSPDARGCLMETNDCEKYTLCIWHGNSRVKHSPFFLSYITMAKQ